MQRDRQTVGSKTPRKTSDGNLTEDAQLSCDLGFQNDTDRDALAVKHFRSQNSLDGVPDGMTKVDKISETGLPFVDCDDMRFNVDTACDYGQQQGLVFGSGRLKSTEMRISSRSGLDCSDDFVGPRFEQREIIVLPDCGGLRYNPARSAKISCIIIVSLALTTSAIPFANSRIPRLSRKDKSAKMKDGCQKAPIKFLP